MITDLGHPIDDIESYDSLLSLPYFDFLACISDGPIHPGGSAATKLLIEKSRLLTSESVLEVGCGPGWTTRALLRNQVKVTAIEKSPSMVRACRHHCKVEGLQVPEIIEGEFDRVLQSLYRKFDLLVFECVIGFLGSDSGLASKVGRLLSQNGRIAILDLHYVTSPPVEVIAELKRVTGCEVHGRTENEWFEFMADYQADVWETFELSRSYNDPVDSIIARPHIARKLGVPNSTEYKSLADRLNTTTSCFDLNKQYMKGHISVWSPRI